MHAWQTGEVRDPFARREYFTPRLGGCAQRKDGMRHRVRPDVSDAGKEAEVFTPDGVPTLWSATTPLRSFPLRSFDYDRPGCTINKLERLRIDSGRLEPEAAVSLDHPGANIDHGPNAVSLEDGDQLDVSGASIVERDEYSISRDWSPLPPCQGANEAFHVDQCISRAEVRKVLVETRGRGIVIDDDCYGAARPGETRKNAEADRPNHAAYQLLNGRPDATTDRDRRHLDPGARKRRRFVAANGIFDAMAPTVAGRASYDRQRAAASANAGWPVRSCMTSIWTTWSRW